MKTSFTSESISPVQTETTYFATVKGILFEGFVNQKARLAREKQISLGISQDEKNLKIRMEKLESRMVKLTYVIAFGTLVAALYYLIEIWEFYKTCR